MEEWKIIKDFQLYSVSNLGNVKHNKSQKLKKLSLDSSGYISIRLMKEDDKKSYLIKVHRIVAQTFLDNPENKQTVNHKNHKRDDNRLDNLEWATMKEQNIHKKSIPLMTGGKGVLQYDLEMNYIQTFGSIREAGRFIDKDREDTTSSHISTVCNGNRPTAYGFIWKHINYDDIENEIWKEITINNVIFNVSNKGRVKSKRNIISFGAKENNGYRRANSNGDNQTNQKIYVHRLVAKTFLNIPEDIDKIIVNHIDGNKENNKVENLEWVTAKENSNHAVKETGTNNTSITHVCNGRYKTGNGFIWKYI